MVSYATKFPINKSFDKYEFVKTTIGWNQGSKFDKIENLTWDNEQYECKWMQNNIKFEIQEIESESIIASRLSKEDERGMWLTDFVLNAAEGTLSVSVSLETTEFTTDFFPTYYPPYFVKMVLARGYAGVDNGLVVQSCEHMISECLDFFKGITSKIIASSLPVIYVARTATGDNPLDVNKLAFRLQGTAHVICEPEGETHPEDSPDLSDLVADKTGKIFVFYPNPNKKSRIFNLTDSSRDSDFLEDRIVNDVYSYMTSRMRKPIDTWEGVSIEKLHISNRELTSNQSAIKKESSEMYDLYEEQLKKMEAANNRLTNENQKLSAELQGLRMKFADRAQHPVLYMGEEQEFYTDEIKEIILEILTKYKKNCHENSRRYHIITDIIENNNYKGIPDQRRERLKTALKGYRTLDASLKSLLESLGFEISKEGKHYKWTYYGDHRYVITASTTASSQRTGIEIASDIDNLLL